MDNDATSFTFVQLLCLNFVPVKTRTTAATERICRMPSEGDGGGGPPPPPPRASWEMAFPSIISESATKPYSPRQPTATSARMRRLPRGGLTLACRRQSADGPLASLAGREHAVAPTPTYAVYGSAAGSGASAVATLSRTRGHDQPACATPMAVPSPPMGPPSPTPPPASLSASIGEKRVVPRKPQTSPPAWRAGASGNGRWAQQQRAGAAAHPMPIARLGLGIGIGAWEAPPAHPAASKLPARTATAFACEGGPSLGMPAAGVSGAVEGRCSQLAAGVGVGVGVSELSPRELSTVFWSSLAQVFSPRQLDEQWAAVRQMVLAA